MTSKFMKQVLIGEKLLLSNTKVKRIYNLPKTSDFTAKKIWHAIKTRNNSKDLLRYFPNSNKKERIPPK